MTNAGHPARTPAIPGRIAFAAKRWWACNQGKSLNGGR